MLQQNYIWNINFILGTHFTLHYTEGSKVCLFRKVTFKLTDDLSFQNKLLSQTKRSCIEMGFVVIGIISQIYAILQKYKGQITLY